ncbi:MAG TPA: sialate O-acetylesterase [Abditibacterium sp.]|jgi:sialate O-acetylesterase
MHQFLKTGLALALASCATLSHFCPATAQSSSATQALNAAQPQPARPFLHPLFSDNMVLQRDISAPVWGWATPGQKVTLTLSGPGMKGATSTAKAGADGKWMAKIRPHKAGGPYTLSISGPQSITLRNVMFGDVWICSGQSNMEMGMGVIDAPTDVAAANYPNIRLFTVPKTVSLTPRVVTSGQWDVCTPQTVTRDTGAWGGFSAVAYFFGKNLHQKLNVPIGLIHSSWGGTVAEAWTHAEVLKTIPDFAPVISQLENQAKDPNGENIELLVSNWWQKNDPGTQANWQNDATETASWGKTNLPGGWELSALPDFDGVVWFRKEVMVPQEWVGKDLTIQFGAIDDRDTTFFNGVSVGSIHGSQTPRSYTVPANMVKAGRNIITVRVLDTGGGGGFMGTPDAMKLSAPDATPISLAGEWSYQVSTPLSKTAQVPVPIVDNRNLPTGLYNGMVAPLTPFGIKGAIWYQGESNSWRGKQYQKLLPAMIKDWRSRFGVGEFPFLIVQLANFGAPREEPEESQWAELREAQALTAQNLPKTGLAVAIDIGEANDIHPKSKQEVGRRLALAAQAIAYGQNVEHSGPVYRSMKVEPGKIRLRFTHAVGLSSKGGEKLRGFAIAGADKKWVWADATVVGNEVVLSSAAVPNPTAARYNWAYNPNGNLTNAAGLPAVPFRTDAQ